MPKYLTEEEKMVKHDLIFNTAIVMFDESSYGEITMNNLAKRCGIAKGTIFKYYATKETLFTCILYKEYSDWVEEEIKELKKIVIFDCESYIKFIHTQTNNVLNKRNRFVRLTSIKRTILDKNIDVEFFSEKMGNLMDQIKEIARLTNCKMNYVSEDEIYDFYQARHIAIVGAYNLGVSEYNTKRLIEINKKSLVSFDIEESILKCIDYYIWGLFYKNKEENKNGKI
jgi:AcrR family transcriptional regulator